MDARTRFDTTEERDEPLAIVYVARQISRFPWRMMVETDEQANASNV